MIEHSVGNRQSHTLEAGATTGREWRSVPVLRGGYLQALVSALVPFLAMPVFAEDGGQSSAPMILFALVMSAPTVWFMYRAYQHCRFHIATVANDNLEAIAQFTAALSHAKNELLIHDDGDKVEGSVYDHDSTIQAIRDRLNECPGLRIKCLLNFNDGVRVTKLGDEFGERFRVRYLHQRPADDVHFKIADRGKWAYLSTHRKGDTERDGEVFDGTRANAHVRRHYVGDLLEVFDDAFEKAHAK